MQRFVWTDLEAAERKAALARPAAINDVSLLDGVRAILAEVERNGDAALKRLTEKFDGVALDAFEVPKAELKAAWDALPQSD